MTTRTARAPRTARTEYAAGYAARVNRQPVPASVSRQWANGYRAAWEAQAAGAQA